MASRENILRLIISIVSAIGGALAEFWRVG